MTAWADPLTSPSSPLPKSASSITITSGVPQRHRLPRHFPHPAHPYQAPTCTHFLSPSDLPSSLTISIPRAPAMLPPPSLLQLWSKLQGQCQPPLSIVSLLPVAAKPLSPFPSLAHAPGSAWPTLSSPMPSPKKSSTWCFPASLEPWDASPLLPVQARPLLPAPPRVRGAWPGGLQQGTRLGRRGVGCGGHQWGPVLRPSTHAAAALPVRRSWRSRDGRRRISGTGPGGKEVREGTGRDSWGKAPRQGRARPGDGGRH